MSHFVLKWLFYYVAFKQLFMQRYGKQFWRSVPFIRLLIPLVTGIVLARYVSVPVAVPAICAATATVFSFCFRFLSKSNKYRWRWVNGGLFNLLFFSSGCLLMYFQDLSNDKNWVGNYAANTTYISVSLQEPLTTKPNSYKALAKTESVFIDGKWIKAKGNIILYFKKDSVMPALQYGSQLIIAKKLQCVIASGNPGSFNYAQYCAFQGIHYQVYLQAGDYFNTNILHKDPLTELLIHARNNVLSIFRKWVPGKTETGVAEALLIGYRDDLDSDLVRAYSNTGVVHIIAISGLHLGMIYGLMLLLLKPFRKYKWMRWAKPLLILFVLWGFSLLAGAAASILRSVVMFSFIVIGEGIGRRTNIYNTLAASAFCLLVYNPYFFWDVGFQLSYTAVLSIVLFMKPVYRWLYFKNKLLNLIWELNSITLAAQVLTLPLILYYFHQFPNLFLFTNFVAVPLSGFILYGELLLLLVCKIPFLNVYTGKAISFLIRQMNTVIEQTDRLPFAVTDRIQVSITQTILLYIALGCIAWWLLNKKIKGLLAGMVCFAGFVFIRSFTFLQQSQQQKMIVYNVPKFSAIDVIDGHGYSFTGDSALLINTSLQNYHLQPARVLYGVSEVDKPVDHMINGPRLSVLLVDGGFTLSPVPRKIPVDIIVISHASPLRITQLAAVFDCKQYVFDNSNPLWKIRYWKKDADSLHLRHHTTSEQGAFEVDL
jgi:competence protein ComEC